MDCSKLLPSIDSKPTFDSVNGVVRLVREEPPAHCMFKVESFSKSYQDHFDSSEFKAGGYSWVLSVYPKGYKQNGGESHLSLYLSMVDKLSSRSFVYVMFRFFLYDHIRDNFVTFLDVQDKLFHADLKSSAGIPKLLSIDVFTNASNGFLVDDCCVFGVELYVVKDGAFTPGAVVNGGLNKKSDWDESAVPFSYTWRIEKFSNLKNLTYSPVFRLGEWSWKLSINPTGIDKPTGRYLSVTVCLDNSLNLPQSSTLYTQFRLSLTNQGGQGNHKKITSRNFPRKIGTQWGFPSFILMNDLHNKGFILNDAIIIEFVIEDMLVE